MIRAIMRRSAFDRGCISPKPTVERVVKAKYIAATLCSDTVLVYISGEPMFVKKYPEPSSSVTTFNYCSVMSLNSASW